MKPKAVQKCKNTCEQNRFVRFDFCGEQMINGSHIHTFQAKTVPAIQKICIITETGTGVAKTLMVPNLHAGATSYKLRIFINRMN